jgi:hypothetical protein
VLVVGLGDVVEGEATADDGGDTAMTVAEWYVISKSLASSPSC